VAFSGEWETQFAAGAHFSEYPWSDLVALVMRHANPKRYDRGMKVIELGPGIGANIPFFLNKGFEYHAIEGSETAVTHIRQRFGDSVHVTVGDFTSAVPYEKNTFDLIVDRGAVTHNKIDDVRSSIHYSYLILKENGLYIGVDWYSIRHPHSRYGKEIEPNTKINIPVGTLKDVGIIHFFTQDEIISLFRDNFEILYLEHKTYETLIPDKNSGWASFNFVARVKK
jgi:hypothetical protein